MPRTIVAIVVLAALAIPAAAGAQPRVDLKAPRDAPPAFRYTAIVKGFKTPVLAELQIFTEGRWEFIAKLHKGVNRKRLRIRRAVPREAKYRVSVLRLNDRKVFRSSERTVRSFTTVQFTRLFRLGEQITTSPAGGTEFLAAAALRGPIDVPAERSYCTRLRFRALLDNVFPGATGALTINQAGRAPQTVALTAGTPATLDVRLRTDRAYQIATTIPAEGPEQVGGAAPDPVLRINGTGRCYDSQPVVPVAPVD